MLFRSNSSISLGRGVAVMDVYTSLDGSKYTLLGRETPPQGTNQPLAAHLIQVNMPARYVKFDILQNYGNNYTGMSEVQFVVGACAGSVTTGGVGCRDSGGTPNTLGHSGCPDRGNTLTLNMSVSPTATSPILLVAGLSDKSWVGIPLPFDLTPLGMSGCSIYTSQSLVFGPFVPAGGLAAHPLPIPASNPLLGARIFFQFLQVEFTLNPPRLATSDYLTVVIG